MTGSIGADIMKGLFNFILKIVIATIIVLLAIIGFIQVIKWIF